MLYNDCPKAKDIHFSIIFDGENQLILTFKKLEQANILHVCLQKD